MTFDEKLAQALDKSAKARAKQMLTVKKKHRFSLAYRLWEHKTLRNLRHNRIDMRWTLRKARYVVAAMIAAFFLAIGGTAYAAVVIIGRYGFVDKVDYSKMLVENHPSDKTTFEEYYGLPSEDGWELENYDTSGSFTVLNYKRGDQSVDFLQRLIDEETITNINTEKTNVEMVSIYTENDGFVLDFDDGVALFWIYDGYVLEIVGNLNKTETINLAYSTKILNLE